MSTWKWVCSCGHENSFDLGSLGRISNRVVTVRNGSAAGHIKKIAIARARSSMSVCSACMASVEIGRGHPSLAVWEQRV